MGRVLFVAFFVLSSAVAFAQQGTGSLRDKVYFGGGGGFGAGTNSTGYRYTYYSLFPLIGYKATEAFSVGTGIMYQHYGYPDLNQTYNQYGIMPFLRYNFGQLFFQSEYQVISSPSYDYSQGQVTVDRQLYNRLLFGIGYSQPLSDNGRSAINAMAMYDVLYKQPSVFNSPFVFRVFVTF